MEQQDKTQGEGPSQQAVTHSRQHARTAIAKHARTVLSADDRDAILAALYRPADPTDELRRAFALHRARVARDG